MKGHKVKKHPTGNFVRDKEEFHLVRIPEDLTSVTGSSLYIYRIINLLRQKGVEVVHDFSLSPHQVVVDTEQNLIRINEPKAFFALIGIVKLASTLQGDSDEACIEKGWELLVESGAVEQGYMTKQIWDEVGLY